MEKEKIVYHYTSINSLFNIINNQSFWLTDLNSSMDKNEIEYGKRLVKSMGKDYLGKDYSTFAPAYNHFALSCTKLKDSYFHFQCYGDTCNGVSIGINKNFIEESVNNSNISKMLHYHLHFDDVIYDYEEQRRILIEKFFDNDTIKQWVEDGFEFKRDLFFSKAFTYSFTHFKMAQFSYENEVRFVYSQDYGGTKTFQTKLSDGTYFDLNEFMLKIGLDISLQEGNPNKYKFATFGKRIRKYYNFSLKEFGMNNAIKSITLGPKCKQNIKELEGFLKDNGLDITIDVSQIELRD